MPQSPPVVLQLTSEAAHLLYDAIYSLGEHQAAGAPIPQLDSRESEVLGGILVELEAALKDHPHAHSATDDV